MRWIPVAVMLFAGCSSPRSVPPFGVSAGTPRIVVEPGSDASVTTGTTTFTGLGGPPCCDNNGNRVGEGRCQDDVCTCETGLFCTCAGTTGSFSCSDACGSDAYVDAICTDHGWDCSGGLIRSDSCAPGTCWGEPGDCCPPATCVDGHWKCDAPGGDC